MNTRTFRAPDACFVLISIALRLFAPSEAMALAEEGALNAEDAAVIRAVLIADSDPGYSWKLLVSKEGRTGCLVLADRTVLPVVNEGERANGLMVFKQIDTVSVSESAVDSMIARNQDPASLAGLSLPPSFLMSDAGLVSSAIETAFEHNSWVPATLLCHDCTGLLRVSLPGYSADGSEALVYVSLTTNMLGDLGYLRHLTRKESGEWEPSNQVVTKGYGPDKVIAGIRPHASQEEREETLREYRSYYGPNVPVVLEERRGRIPSKEREALVALYRATDGDHWRNHAGWLGPPGTECGWAGVRCWMADPEEKHEAASIASDQELFVVTGLILHANNLRGAIPPEIADLTHLEYLTLADNNLRGPLPEQLDGLSELRELVVCGNKLSGSLPKGLLARWDAGTLRLVGYAGQFSPITQVEIDVKVSGLLCGDCNAVIKSGIPVTLRTLLCRKATPDDRATYTETKTGTVSIGDIDRLARLVEAQGFFDLKDNYSRNITHGNFETITVTRGGERKSVEDYAGAAPWSFWQIKTAIRGVLFEVQWVKVEKSAPAEH